MALPTFVSIGTNMTSATTNALSWPSSLAIDDLMFCFITHRDEAVSHPTPSGETGTIGWTELGTSVVQGAARITVYTTYLTSATPSGGTISDSGDRTGGRLIAFRHVSGRPSIHGHQNSTDPTSDTTGSATGFTTTIADCMILILCCGDGPDATGTAEFSGFTNAALGTLTERSDNSVVTGLGGSWAVATGTLAVAGAIGNTTYTHATACVKACKVIAIGPPTVFVAPPTLERPRAKSARALIRR